MFLQLAGTFNHYKAKKPKRKSLPDIPAIEQFKMMAEEGGKKRKREREEDTLLCTEK
jgi:hypothetical protein